jgi:glycosyltransferase involved in cell wall biosynthesis
VLQLDPQIGATVQRYRVANLAEQLISSGCRVTAWNIKDLEREVRTGAVDSSVADVDLIVLHRFPYCTAVERLLDAARKASVKTAFEADDLVFVPGIGRWVDGVRHLEGPERPLYDEGLERYAASYSACDAFIGATSFLAGLRAFGPKPSIVVPNLLGGEQVAAASRIRAARRKRTRADELSICYGAGTRTHDRDLASIASALAEVMRSHAHVRLDLVGPVELPSELEGLGDRVRLLPIKPWEEWWGTLAGSDIALAPLEERNPYCRSKSGLKYLEAGVLGIPLVASRIDGYEEILEEGRTGWLASGHDEWVDCLSRLVGDSEVRRAIGSRAREDVLERHCTAACSERTLAALEALVDGEVDPGSRPARWRGFDFAYFTPPAQVGSGGHKIIFRTARGLIERGHRATILHEPDARAFDDEQVEAFIDRAFFPTGATHRSGWDVDTRGFDAAVATAWNTSELVSGLDVPARLYLVQDLEHFFFPAGEDHVRAEQTYRLGLSCITIGRWLTEVMRRRYGADSVDFPFLLHVACPRPDRASEDRRPTITYFAQPGKMRRAYPMGVQALAKLHATHPEVRICFFGSEDVDPTGVPFPFEDLGILSEDELEELYLKTDIGLVISLTNPSAVPQNMMRCGCAVVDVDLENNHYEYENGRSALLAPPTADGLAEALSGLVVDRALRERLQQGAVESLSSRSEPAAMDLIEAACVRAVLTGRVSAPWVLDCYEPGGQVLVSLAEGEAVARFSTRLDGLCAVAVMLKTEGVTPGDLAIRLRRVADGVEVVHAILPGSSLRDAGWTRFEFEAVADSAGQEWELALSMLPGGAPVAVYRADGPSAGRTSCSVGGMGEGPIRLCAYANPDARGSRAPDPRLPRPAQPARHGLPLRSTTDGGGLVSEAASPVPPAARRVADLLRDMRRRDVEARREADQRLDSALRRLVARLARVEAGVRSVSVFLQRARSSFGRVVPRRWLAALRVLTPDETYIESTHFVTPELRSGATVSQRFVAVRDGLSQISIRFATEGRQPSNDVRLRLLDGDGRRVLRQVHIPAAEISDNEYVRAVFPPVTDSAQSSFTFELASPDGLWGCGARVWGERNGRARGHLRLQDGHRARGRIAFILGYES